MRDSGTTDSVLVVDLDGTLLRSDMLFECFWAALSKDWQAPVTAARALKKGIPALKRAMADSACPDVAHLPYNPDVIAHIEGWRAKGGRVALVTASDQTLADRIATHLGLFDEVFGTTPEVNLKGSRKAAFLADHYGAGSFVYMGDSAADLAVWQRSRAAITVGASGGFRARVEAVNGEVSHLSPPEPLAWPILKAMRPHQWLKNILIFVPVLASHSVTGLSLLQCLVAFLAFGLVASSGYVLNDLLDLDPDRAHARKRNRPLASGRLQVPAGTALFPALLMLGLATAAALGPSFLGVIAFYFTMTLSYSLWLKRKVIVDICVLAGLYTLRIVAGSMATAVPLSIWLLAFSMFFFFALAAVKRQAELVHVQATGQTKAAGRGYGLDDLPIVTQIATSSGLTSVLVLALYINSPEVLMHYRQPVLLWGVCVLLLFWITRVVFITHQGKMTDDPLVFAVTDRTSQVSFAVIAALGLGAAFL
ncbi:UbiA family prenyltransferase [Nioella nitratireducens]|uniref:UbiA family prenyltransferase n=1 Tax=Nioella nitratireducens TaxID=1287720 RepID=UPI0008FD564E|nr:UbiA family prenyltransferase [Nioella nitratireducens]